MKEREIWQAFTAATYPEQLTIFQQAIAEKSAAAALIDRMLETLYLQTARHDERDRFQRLVATLRQESAPVYAQLAPILLQWLLLNALVAGHSDVLSTLAEEMVPTAVSHFTPFSNTLDMLAYHDQTAVMVEMMQQAWPAIKEADSLKSRVKDDFAARATDHLIFQYLQETPTPDANDPALQQRLQYFFDIDAAGLVRYLNHLTGQADHHWQIADFDFGRSGAGNGEKASRPASRANQNLAALMVEFVGYLRRQENVPYAKGHLVRLHIPDYLMLRRSGQLAPRQNITDLMRGTRPFPPTTDPQPPHPLCPDQPTLQQYLSKLLHFARPRPYRAIATFELVPAWLRFLQSAGLIDASQRRETVDELQKIKPPMRDYWQENPYDPALQQAIEQWGEDAL